MAMQILYIEHRLASETGLGQQAVRCREDHVPVATEPSPSKMTWQEDDR